jgi:arabinose-5-phosphate isomerase
VNVQQHPYLLQARNILADEAAAVNAQINLLGDDFIRVVDLIRNRAGRVVVTGIGKSGLIGRKISATLSSTGTPSLFLHPADAVHGDLGMVTAADVIMAISNSGEADEVLAILPVLKIIGAPIIAVTKSPGSTLAQNSEYYLPVAVEREACPLGLAPSSSTTAVLAVGDALALVLLNVRQFKAEDFALYHPSGALGRKLLLTAVGHVMHPGTDITAVSPQKTRPGYNYPDDANELRRNDGSG